MTGMWANFLEITNGLHVFLIKERKCLCMETVMRKGHGKLKPIDLLWRKTKFRLRTVPETAHALPHPGLPVSCSGIA